MSVQSQTPFNSYTANGATTVFPYSFLLLESGDLVVSVDGVVKTLATDYTISGLTNPAGGNVTFVSPPANGAKVLLSRLLTIQRLTDYQDNGDLYAATINNDLDRLWLALQQLQQNDIRALKLPFDTATDQVIPEDAAARANKGVKFDSAGNLILSDYDPDEAQTDSTAAAAAAAASASAASSSETNAAASAASASASATSASNSAAAAQAAVGAVLVSNNDTTAGKLSSKLAAGAGVALSVQTPGGNESLKIGALLHGQCRLVKSGANLVLQPFNGNKLIINGAVQTIPAAGVSLAATGLTVGANYYIYAYMAGSTMTLDASATGHSTDATTGVEIKTGDATRTLVGFARVITGPAWQDTSAQRFVRSWFNEASISGRNAASSDKTTTSTSWVAISTAELRIEFLSWAGEKVIAAFSGEASINLDNQFVYTALYLDGAPTSGGGYAKHSRGAYSVLSGMGHHVSTQDDIAEGYHYVDVYGAVSIETATGTWIGGTSPKRSNINFRVAK